MKPHLHTLLFLFIALAVLTACNNGNTDDNKGDDDVVVETGITEADLQGEWVSSSIRVEIKSPNGEAGDDTIIEASEENYPEVLGIKANFSTLNADGTYEDTYHMLTDSIERGNGKWSISGDSITFTQEVPDPRVHVYHMELQGDSLLKVSGMVDFDGDGEKDDLFSGDSYRRE